MYAHDPLHSLQCVEPRIGLPPKFTQVLCRGRRGRAMMGRLNRDQGQLFYSFCLDEMVLLAPVPPAITSPSVNHALRQQRTSATNRPFSDIQHCRLSTRYWWRTSEIYEPSSRRSRLLSQSRRGTRSCEPLRAHSVSQRSLVITVSTRILDCVRACSAVAGDLAVTAVFGTNSPFTALQRVRPLWGAIVPFSN